jgi:hypothetical protein
MRLATAYRLTLGIPILLAVVLIVTAAALGDRLETLGAFGAWLGDGALWATAAAGPFGILYFIFLGLAWSWGHTASPRALWLALNLAPVLFLALVTLGWGLVALAAGDWDGMPAFLGAVATFVLAFGYVCVGLAHLGIATLRWKGIIEPAA